MFYWRSMALSRIWTRNPWRMTGRDSPAKDRWMTRLQKVSGLCRLFSDAQVERSYVPLILGLWFCLQNIIIVTRYWIPVSQALVYVSWVAGNVWADWPTISYKLSGTTNLGVDDFIPMIQRFTKWIGAIVRKIRRNFDVTLDMTMGLMISALTWFASVTYVLSLVPFGSLDMFGSLFESVDLSSLSGEFLWYISIMILEFISEEPTCE